MSEPMERHISITSTTTNTNGVVTQVTHASVHVVASGYLRPKHAPQSLIDRLEATLDHCCDE